MRNPTLSGKSRDIIWTCRYGFTGIVHGQVWWRAHIFLPIFGPLHLDRAESHLLFLQGVEGSTGVMPCPRFFFGRKQTSFHISTRYIYILLLSWLFVNSLFVSFYFCSFFFFLLCLIFFFLLLPIYTYIYIIYTYEWSLSLSVSLLHTYVHTHAKTTSPLLMG